MRLKALPEDFRVSEDLVYPQVQGGAYYVHLVRKQKLTTQEALARIARIGDIERSDIAFAGLKDRQGQTEQWITIRGRRFDYADPSMQVSLKGRTDRPITSKMSRGNYFEIVVRGLDGDAVNRLRTGADAVRIEGLPNYFDDQRFGCLRHGQGFAMRSVLRGDCDSALHQLVARPSPKAVTGDVKLKRLLERNWGDWETCAKIARGPLYGRVFSHLVARPADFAGALSLLPTRLKLIHAFAYQSWLWNRTVDRMLWRMLPRKRVSLMTRSGTLIAWDGIPAALVRRLETFSAPLPAPGGGGGEPEYGEALGTVIDDEGLTRAGDAPVIKGMQLREEPRPLLIRPRDLFVGQAERDELDPGQRKVALAFGLPRGAYATLVVKRLFASHGAAGERDSQPRGRRGKGFEPRSRSAKTRERES